MENPRNALRSVASTSLLRHVAPPEGVHECFHEVGRSSPFWARKFARRQEPTPPAPVGDDYSGGGDATEARAARHRVHQARLT